MCNDHPVQLPRRGLLAVSAASLVAGSLAAPALAQTAKPAPNAMTPDQALKRLMDGNARYVANAPDNKDFSAGRAARAQSQHPFAGLLSCADFRVALELAFDQSPGELFVVRVAGNFVNTDGLASLEFGVKVLGMPLIMVLGPAEAPLAVVRGRHRFRLLVHAARNADVQGDLRAWLAALPDRGRGPIAVGRPGYSPRSSR